jgi:hypothetical protein
MDAYCLLIGLALGAGFAALIGNAGVGIGTGLAMGITSCMARRANGKGWLGWLGIYSLLYLAAYVLKITGALG